MRSPSEPSADALPTIDHDCAGCASATADVVLVSMPFGVLHSPSLALGLLQARLSAEGITTRTRHFTLDYADRIGLDLYERIASGFPRTTDLLGEWIFSHALAPKTPVQQEHFLARTFATLVSHGAVDASDAASQKRRMSEKILEISAATSSFVDCAAREILEHAPKVVGLTTVFQQNTASLAVAARLRQLDPSVRIVLGGANCEGPMGRQLARSFPFIDCVVSGEADLFIVPLIRSLLAGIDPRAIVGQMPSIDPASCDDRFFQTGVVADLDGYVSPAFDDYFRDLDRLGDGAKAISVHVPLETSRGCWWGMKHHCTFCGLNGATMAFRSRSPVDALREIVSVASRYPDAKISFVDNIMDYRYFDALLPQLAALGGSFDLFYEIKSNVTKAQVRTLRDAGVRHIQPGIESLSDDVLKIMRKGVSAVQNVQLLKWCAEFGVRVDWNILWGFPDEAPDDYRRMASLVPLLSHLEPPARGSTIRLDRFSPNFTQSSQLGFSNVRPYPAYYDVYDSVADDGVFNLAYFFEADTATSAEDIRAYTNDLSQAITCWRASHAASSLTYLERDGRVVIFDARPLLSRKQVDALDGLRSAIYLLCDSARSIASISRELPDALPEDIAVILDGFCAQGTMWLDHGHYLSLAVSLTTFLQSRRSPCVESAIDGFLPATERLDQNAFHPVAA